MYLSRIHVENFRLLIDANLRIDKNVTLIVGRNNTAKTSLFECIKKVLNQNEKSFTFDDYPISKRTKLAENISKFINDEIDKSEFEKSIECIAVEFIVDYSSDDMNTDLGALSPFILDVDPQITTALIRVENCFASDRIGLQKMFSDCKEGDKYLVDNNFHNTLGKKFSSIFKKKAMAINPKATEQRQEVIREELYKLFPFSIIPAERTLGEDDAQKDSLSQLIQFFFTDDNKKDQDVEELVDMLRNTLKKAERDTESESNEILNNLIKKAVPFGYPNGEDLQLRVRTNFNFGDTIQKETRLTYIANPSGDNTDDFCSILPSSHNGLGYKNLIKIEFLLASFTRQISDFSNACIPLLFVEEPESHMHPQMQNSFAKYLEEFLNTIVDTHVQAVLTTHSSHIVNSSQFSKIRYARKTQSEVSYLDLQDFTEKNTESAEFVRKYMTLTKCDLFFADKAIFVEGTSERILIPDMIRKCHEGNVFSSYPMSLLYQYCTLIEVGGAYIHLFIPFIEFIKIPSLIITDLDAIGADSKKCLVSQGVTTSNSTIKYWYNCLNNRMTDTKTKILLNDIQSVLPNKKTINNWHIEFQVAEKGICGRSLEEAIINANRQIFNKTDSVQERDLVFSDKKTDFALKLILENPNYEIPKYIKDGLIWLNSQNIVE